MLQIFTHRIPVSCQLFLVWGNTVDYVLQWLDLLESSKIQSLWNVTQWCYKLSTIYMTLFILSLIALLQPCVVCVCGLCCFFCLQSCFYIVLYMLSSIFIHTLCPEKNKPLDIVQWKCQVWTNLNKTVYIFAEEYYFPAKLLIVKYQ